MSTITKEQLITQAQENVAQWRDAMQHNVNTEYAAIRLRLAEIALASLEAEPVGYIDAEYAELLKSGHIESCSVYAEPGEGCIALYAAQPAAVSVPDERAELQGADGTLISEDTKRVGELVMWVKRLAHSLRKANPDSKLQSDAMDYLSRKGLIGVEDILR